MPPDNARTDVLTVNYTPVADTTPPGIAASTPAAGASGVALTASVSVTFNEPMSAATISGSTIELRNASNALIPATVSYDAGNLPRHADSQRAARCQQHLHRHRPRRHHRSARQGRGGQCAGRERRLVVHHHDFQCADHLAGHARLPASLPKTTPGRWSSASSSAPISRASSRACASTRARSTPACTPAACGSASGQLLASGTFVNETATGWQQAGLRDAGGDRRQHHLRGLVFRAEWRLCRQRQLLHVRRHR